MNNNSPQYSLEEIKNINSLIDCIYSDRFSLTDFMSFFMKNLREQVYFDKSDFMFFTYDTNSNRYEMQSFSPINWTSDEVDSYIDTYMHMDDVLPILSQSGPIAFRNNDLFCLKERSKTQYYKEFARPAKLEISIDANIPLHNNSDTIAILGLFRDPSRKEFSIKELETIKLLQNHLANGMQRHLTNAEIHTMDDMFSSLDNFEALGICMLDEKRNIISYNTTFKNYAKKHGTTIEESPIVFHLNRLADQLPKVSDHAKIGPISIELDEQTYLFEVSYQNNGKYMCILYSLSDFFLRRLTSLKQKYSLSNREFEILYLMLKKGLTNEEVSNSLFISPATVKRHLSTAYQKIGINNQKQLLNLLKVI